MRKYLTFALIALAITGGVVAVSTLHSTPALADDSGNGGGGH